MGTIYNYCDCKNKDTRPEEKFSTANMKSDKLYFFRNNNNSIKTINTSTKNTKDSIDLNYAANIIIKNYKMYKKEKEEKQLLYNRIQYEKNLKRNNHKENNNDQEDNSSSFLSNNSYLKKIKNLKEKNFNYIGGKGSPNSKEGFGITIWNNANKTRYIGYYKNNKANGYGKFIDGIDKYFGEFKDDEACGFGIYEQGDDLIYTGYWSGDLEENYGIEKWKDGAIYKGEFLKGKKHGIGTYIWSDGSRYEGNWNNNKLEGFGIRYYNEKKVFIGEWRNSLKEGFGELLLVGRKYIGFFSKDKKEGFGICYWEKKNKAFVGFWKNGKQLGFGKFMTRNKRKYGLWITDTQVNWFKSEEEAFENLEEQGLKSFKTFFLFTLDDIRNYCINNDDFNELLNKI